MKLPRKTTLGLVIAGLGLAGVVCAVVLFGPGSNARQAVEETRRVLRQEGFKVDLAEFDFSTPDDSRAREAALTRTTPSNVRGSGDGAPRRAEILRILPGLMVPRGSNTALVVWKHSGLSGGSGTDWWELLRQSFAADRPGLDAACQAALAGPVRFNLNAGAGTGMFLPHLAALNQLTQMLGARAMLELHDGNTDAAWIDLLASTRLVTSWEPEPIEISHLVRFTCATIVYNATWQCLQRDGWDDRALQQLQEEWESADFFRGLAETAAFERARFVAVWRQQRLRPMAGLGMTFKDAVRSPRSAWSALMDYWRRYRYRQQGAYEDEKALLLYYRDRELELRRAVQSPTWSEMRSLPGVTNQASFQSKYASETIMLMNSRRIAMEWSRSEGLLARAAEAETRRRLILTAIAIERYRRRHGSYPDTLQELVPDLLKRTPVDFMDGQPLRYRRTDDGLFVLYSTGLDCADDGGQLPSAGPGDLLPDTARRPRGPGASDLVWPRQTAGSE